MKKKSKSKVLSGMIWFIWFRSCVEFISFQPKLPEKYNAFCLASKSNKQNPPSRTSDLPFFLRYKNITFLKTTFLLRKARVCPTGFEATLAALVSLIYRLRKENILCLQSLIAVNLGVSKSNCCYCITKSVLIIFICIVLYIIVQ